KRLKCPRAVPQSEWGLTLTLAVETIKKRIAAHLKQPPSLDHVPRLVDLAAQRLSIIEDSDSFEDIPLVVLGFHIWQWDKIAYPAFRRALQRLSCNPDSEKDESPVNSIDEWILVNEKWLRDGQQTRWNEGLVTLNDADGVFPNSTLTHSERTIKRPDPLPGFEMLCAAREPHITIQPSVADFERMFETMSDGLLKNLDWNNILVAGGIVLGTLLSIDSPNPRWMSSDIDVYIYGLSQAQANEKVKHLFETFCANLPPGAPTLAVKNSTTITFYSQYPLRRIQIVLKLVESPKTVLLNFDLDICAMAWDGSTVWMLPRAARALETGYNVFTMSLIHGHYLSDRRASSQERIFKYADKGYGIRILPSYLSSLGPSKAKRTKRNRSQGRVDLDIISIAETESEWTTTEVTRMAKHGCPIFFQALMPKHAGYRASRCLKGFRIFMRCPVGNGPARCGHMRYKWDEKFKIEAFQKRIEGSNLDEIFTWIETDFNGRLEHHGVSIDDYSGVELQAFRRIVCAPTVEELFSKKKDILLQVLLPCPFAVYANDLVSRAQADAGVPETKLLQAAVPGFNFLGSTIKEADGLFFWRIGKDLMWQQSDRRVDECVLSSRATCHMLICTDTGYSRCCMRSGG
ncbi:hypothetical protein C8R46DRAFT_1118026, partial [Mycena filopes]